MYATLGFLPAAHDDTIVLDAVQYADIANSCPPVCSKREHSILDMIGAIPRPSGEHMPVRIHFRRITTEDFLKLLLPFIFSFLIGVFLKWWHPSYWWLYGISSPLADAFVVAGIIGVGLEVVATKFLIESAADDLAQKLVGMGLPRDLQKHILGIVDTKFVRDHYVKSYLFSDPVGDRIGIDMEVSFDVVNYSNSAIDYLPEMDEEECFKPQFLLLEYGIRGKALHSLGREQLLAREKGKHPPSTTTRLVDGDKKVSLEPIRDDPTAICSVRWKWRVLMPREFSDTTEFRYPTLGATLRLVDAVPA